MRFSSPSQFADLSLIFKGQRPGERFLQARLQECDVPNVAPNELHENPVIRLCVAAHVDSLDEQIEKVIHRLASSMLSGVVPEPCDLRH